MNNIINNWSYETPTLAGEYLICYGDIETPANVDIVVFTLGEGTTLRDGEKIDASKYSKSIKFARLVYSPTEIKEIEGGKAT